MYKALEKKIKVKISFFKWVKIHRLMILFDTFEYLRHNTSS